MITSGTFSVESFEPVDWSPEITTALATGHMHMVKTYDGRLTGSSITQFSSSYDMERGVGTYLSLESFEGTLDGRRGAFNYAHSATASGSSERMDEIFVIVPHSGTEELAGLTGTHARAGSSSTPTAPTRSSSTTSCEPLADLAVA